MSEELKPCPFCGARADLVVPDNHDDYFYVFCANQDTCLADMGPHSTGAEAVTAWNRRKENPK